MDFRRVARTTAAIAALAATLCAEAGATTPSFSLETPVPGFDDGGGFGPALARTPAGTAIVWTGGVHNDRDGFGMLLDPAGVPVAGKFVVNSYTSGDQVLADVVTLLSGDLVVVWSSTSLTASQSQDGDGSGVIARRFSSTGVPLGPELLINTYTTGHQTAPRAAALPDGGFVVVWEDAQALSYHAPELHARRYSAAGSPLGTMFQVNAYTTGPQTEPAVAAQSGGGFVIVWTSQGQGGVGSDTGIVGARFDSLGAAIGSEFVVNAYTTGLQSGPDVAELPTGDFVVAWKGRISDENISLQRFDSTGTPLGAQVRTDDIGSGDPRISVLGSDEIAVVSEGLATDRILGRRFDASIAPRDDAFRIQGNWQFAGTSFDVLADGAGGFVSAWSGDVVGPPPFGSILTNHACIDDGADADGDGIGDACDLCENAGAQTMDVKPRLRTKWIGPDLLLDNDRISFSAEFDLPGGFSFASLDPTTVPVRLRLEGATGTALAQIELAASSFAGSGTRGWTTNSKGNKWAFKDKTGTPANGILTALLQDRASSAPGRVRIKLKGRDGNYPINPSDAFVKLIVLFGDGSIGECAETAFTAEDCKFTGLGTRFGCKL